MAGISPSFQFRGSAWRAAILAAIVAVFVVAAAWRSLAQTHPDLVLTGTIAPNPVSVGELVTFTLNVTNTGTTAASQVTLNSTISSSNASVFAVTVSQGSFSQTSSNTVTCNIGSVAVGAGTTVRITATPLAIGGITNLINVTEFETDQNPANNSIAQTLLSVPLTFYPGPVLNVGRAYHTATRLPDGKVLIAGGNTATGWTATAEIYNPATKTFALAANMQRPRALHTATLLNDGTVLIVGIASGLLNGAEIYNPTNNTFTSISNTLNPHEEHVATLLADGRVLIANDSYTYPLNSAEVYVPVLRGFTNLPNTIYGGTKNQGIRLDDGRVLIAGGGQGGGYAPASASEIFDPASGTFSAVGPMTRDRTYYGATKLLDGRIFYVGGISGGQQSADLFYTNTQTFLAVSNSTRGLHYTAMANRLADGTVLVMGWSKQAELFNPTNDSFMRTVEMQSGRLYSTATTLTDGTVLIAGGLEQGTFAVLSTSEIYDAARTKAPPAFSIRNEVVAEGNSGTTNLVFNVTLSSPMGVSVSVDYSTADWNAYAGDDYAATNGTLIFTPGVTTQTVSVVVFGDRTYEGDEILNVSLSNPTNAVIDVATGTGTILNDDPLPVLTATPAARYEGNRLTANLVFNLSLDRTSAADVYVDYRTVDGTAQAGSDYVATNGTAVISAGTTNTTVSVIINGDTQIEPDELFYLQLSNVVNAVQGTTSVTGTILDDDGAPGWLHHFQIALPAPPLFAGGPIPITIIAKDAFNNLATNVNGRALLSVGTTDEAPQWYGFEDGVLGDWTPSNGGQQPGPYEVKFFDVNGDGDFSWAFRTAAGIGVDGITRNVNLIGGKRYYVSGDFAQSDEGGGNNGGDTQAYLSLGGTYLATAHFGGVNSGDVLRTNLNGIYDAPYTGPQSLGLLFSRNPWFETYPIGALADDVVISSAPIVPRWTASFTNGVWTGSNVVSIVGTNLVLYVRGLEGHTGVSSAFTLEQYGNVGLSATVSPASPRVGSDLVITVTATNLGPGTAPGVILTNPIPSGPLFVSATSTVGNCTVNGGIVTCNFGSMAPNQTASMTLTLRPTTAGTVTNLAALAPSAYDPFTTNNLASNNIVVGPALISVSNPTVTELAGGTTNAVFQITVGDPHSDTITVDFATANVTAVSNADYLAIAGSLTFPPGTSTQSVSVAVLDDSLAELSETFRLQLSNPLNAVLSGSGFGTATILDNGDPIPSATINDVTLLEGDSGTTNAVFTVTLDRAAGYTINISYATANGTATSSNDFIGASGSLNFSPGQLTQNIFVQVRGDTVNEPNEVFYLNLSTNRQSPPVNLVRTQAVCTILNDDAVPGRLDHFDWVVSSPRVRSLPFAVTLTARDAFNNVATNNLSSIPISATGGANQTQVAISPTQATPFSSGVWNGQLTINSAATNVVLRADDGQQHIGLSAPFDVLNAITVTLSAPANINETNGLMAGQGLLSVGLTRVTTTTFNLSSSDTSELMVPSTVVLPANATSAPFDLTAIDDGLLDGTKKVSITASATGYTTTNVQVSVHDNEFATLTLSAPSNAVEGVNITGVVMMSAPAGDNVSIGLSSSDPAQLQVPASVTILSGQTSNTFTITPVDDANLDGPKTAVITAHVENWTDGVTAVTVQDNETNTVTIAFGPPGSTYYEGSGPVSNATVRLGGIVTTNVTVSLQSSDTTEAIVPASVMIPAGTNVAFLPLSIPDDSLFDGTQTAVLTPIAPGFVSVPVTVTVGDNELHHFSLTAIPSNVEANAPVAVSIMAKDINDATMFGFTGSVGLLATNANGVVPMSPANVLLTGGQWTGTITFPNWEYAGARLIVSFASVSNASSIFNVVPPTLTVVSATGSDLAYSAMNGRLYVNSSGGFVTPINALQAQAETSVNVGNLGTRMVASNNGQFLFLEQTGGNLCRFNVAANAADVFWASGAPQIEDMAAVPGWPTAVAVARMDTSTSPRTRGTIVYDNGVPLPNTGGGNVIDFAAPSRRLYIYNNETTGFGTAVYDADANGLTPVKSLGLMSGFGVNFVCRGGLIFATTGQIFNPDRGIVIGGNPYGMLVAGDGAEGRFYGWQSIGGGQSAIVAQDLYTLLPIGSTILPGVTTATGNLIRWGTNGLAFRPNGSTVAIVRSLLVPSAPAADLVLTQAGSSGPTTVGGTYSCTFAISNAGPNMATNVIFTATLPPNTTLSSITSPNGTCSTINGGVIANITSLSNGGNASVTFAFTPNKPGPLAFKASVLSGAADANPANNRLSIDLPAIFISGYDSIIELALSANDLVYDNVHNRICASVPNTSELLGNSIVTFDPLSAFYPSLIPTAMEPAKLAVADNGQYVYAGLGSETSIQRINLINRVADLKFPTGYNAVNDMEVMPGNAGVVAATVHTTVVVYENGVPRPNVVGPTEYNFGYSLEFGATSNRLYASFPWGFRRINVDTNGATLIEDVRNTLIVGYDYDMDFGSGLIYSANGRVFDPETKTMVATLPYTGLVIAGPLSAYAYYLTTSGSTATLHVIDMPTRSEIKSINIPGINGSTGSFIRWGADGFAFRTSGGQVFLVRATIADDQDGDGLADSWEKFYFGSINAPNGGPNDDADGDGMSNLDEFRAGTNPLDRQSYLRIDSVRIVANQPRLAFATASGKRYRIERSLTLPAAGWTPVADNITGTGGTVEVIDPASGNANAFYRLVLLP